MSASRFRQLVLLLIFLALATPACKRVSETTAPEQLVLTQQASTEVHGSQKLQDAETSVEKSSTQRMTGPQLDDLIVNPPASDDQGYVPAKSLATLREERDATVWHLESVAQQYEQAIVRLWDQLLVEQRKPGNGNPYRVFSDQSLESLKIGLPDEGQMVCWGAAVHSLNRQPQVILADEWESFVNKYRDEGYQIEQTEWHHSKFDVDESGLATSTITMAIYAVHPTQETRHVLAGDLIVHWQARMDEQAMPVVKSVDATNLRLFSRTGRPAFSEILTVDHATPSRRSGVQPISVHDFNGDGLSEIILGGSNELFWNLGEGKFEKDTLLTFPERGFEVSLIADVTGDGVSDYLLPGLGGDLLMFVGDDDGRFTSSAKGKARGGGPLRQPQVIAAGDVDSDGDIDLWIGQYRISYLGGQMPTPYYDANDGFPAYLLVNQGDGRFTPRTEEAGLATKANRRSYAGSFVDLDGDRDLDLVVVSDFAGIDVYLNDGKGQFSDVTAEMVDERHLFGMSVTFADYDRNGQLDFFATGMASTTARRLDYMGLGRHDRPEIHKMRSVMGYGNRMYLANSASTFAQPGFVDQVARTGWSWGSTSFDFDNDSYPDIFVANGHSSGESTKDHCSHFWCHDIYDATSMPNGEVFDVFQNSMKGYFDRSESWDGYQKNQLLVNLQGRGFVNLGYLMGVGHEYDGRAVISDDIDGDGRLDLLVVEDKWREGQLLHVYRNSLETDNHWIGAHLVDVPGSDSPLGATVVLTLADGGRRAACVTAGDSIHAQHASTVHFGLGPSASVRSLELQLTSGKTITLEAPEIDRYHRVEIE